MTVRVSAQSHNAERGSTGLILNKPMPCTIGDFTEKLAPLQNNRIYYGGAGSDAGGGGGGGGSADQV